MRVAILTTSFPVTRNSVSGAFIFRLVRHLPDTIRPTVIAPAATSLPDVAGEANFDLVCFRYAPRRLQILAHQPGGIPAALASNKFSYMLLPFFLVAMFFSCLRVSKKTELIHANWSVNGFIAGLVGALRRKPVIVTLRGSDVARATHSFIHRFLLRVSVKLCVRIVAVSDGIHATVAKLCPGSGHKLLTIPNGVDSAFLNVVRASPDVLGNRVRLASIGNLIPGKGVTDIIRAIALIDDEHNIELTIIGDGPQRQELEALVRTLGLSDRITFLGAIAPDAVPPQFAKTDVFVLASYSEGRPNVILEAMACGVSVIASDIDGVAELVHDEQTGLLFEPGNVEQLRTKITRLCADASYRKAMGAAAREYLLRNGLVWSNTAQRYAQLYKSTLDFCSR